MTHRALIVFGTRPEAIKVAPVVHAMRSSDDFEAIVAVTAQHRSMLDEVLRVFEIEPDHDLDIMREGQTLTQITMRALEGLSPVIEDVRPDLLVVQGDTSTTFVGALAAFYHRVPVAHIEAGYRTGDKHQPFPEEANRRLVSEIAEWHFAVNEGCREHLLREGHSDEVIRVVGNTGIDALRHVGTIPLDLGATPLGDMLESGTTKILMTMHRRENWGAPIESACRAARRLVEVHPEIEILFAVHLNPVVQASARAVLEGVERVRLLPALDYLTFSKVLHLADVVMSDSGGIHEEALALGKPLLMLRNVSEWPEAVASGQTRLVGTDEDRIVGEAAEILDALASGRPLPRLENPLADGHASERALAHLRTFLAARG